MTPEQKKDLYIEWEITSSQIKAKIKAEYEEKYGTDTSLEHWENYLIEALNVRPMWLSEGLLKE